MRIIKKAGFGLVLALSATLAQAMPPTDANRLDEVAERGRHVMPFDLEKTLHVFEKTDYGGIQQVIAKDASDNEQISLIRQHLSELVKRFRQGDFSRQHRIHGKDMPGIVELAESYQHIQFNYKELANGAEIEYAAEEPALVDAIHRYFNAQLRDHARHAVGGAHHCKHKAHRHKGQGASMSKTIKE